MSDLVDASDRKACPDMQRCREHVEAIAPFDAQLYALGKKLEARWLSNRTRSALRSALDSRAAIGVCEEPEPERALHVVKTSRGEKRAGDTG